MPNEKPSELELQILGVLWRSGPATARDVLGAMPDGKARAYTTVLSLLQGMEQKSLVARTREGLTDRWRAAVTKSKVFGPLLRSLVTNVFGGRPSQVLQHLLQETKVDADDMAEIGRMLEDFRTQSKRPGKKRL